MAVRRGKVVGYLLGGPRGDFGPDVAYVGTAGHAATEPEVMRDLYGAVAASWAEAGRVRQVVLVPASDRPLLDTWFRLSFGQQHRDDPGGERLRRHGRAHRARTRVGKRAELRRHEHGLARDELALVPLLASARISAGLRPALPPHSLTARPSRRVGRPDRFTPRAEAARAAPSRLLAGSRSRASLPALRRGRAGRRAPNRSSRLLHPARRPTPRQ